MDVKEFQNKLKEIQEVAKAQGNTLKAGQIRECFAGGDLDRNQLLGVLKYLTTRGIEIEGAAVQTEETQEERKQIPLTGEEEAYLKEYIETLPEAGSAEEKETMFRKLAEGDQMAVQTLAAWYLKEAADLAVEMNAEEIFLGDLIQEANVSLMQALGGAGDTLRTEEWLLKQVKLGLTKVLEEQSQQKFADDSLIARVEKLENAVRELSDDEDGKCEFSVAELAVILDMNVEEIRDTLRLTGDDK